MKAIILAAGYATRLYPLTLNTPKALLPIGGTYMMDYLVREIVTLPGMTEIHVVSNHKFAARFEEWRREAEVSWPGMRFFVWDDGTSSNDDRLGAVGDMQYVIEHARLDDDVLVAASDNFFTFPLRIFEAEFRRQGRDMLLAGRIDDIDTLRRFAVATMDEDGRVITLAEKPQEPQSNIGIYALYLYKRETLPRVKEFLDGGNTPDSPGQFPAWLSRVGHPLGAYVFEGECVDIGTPESYREVCERFGGKPTEK